VEQVDYVDVDVSGYVYVEVVEVLERVVEVVEEEGTRVFVALTTGLMHDCQLLVLMGCW